MIPINIISKLTRSRSYIILTKNPIMTSGTLWGREEGSKNDGGSKCGEDSMNKQSCAGEEQERIEKMNNSFGESHVPDKSIKDRDPPKSTCLGVITCNKGKDESQNTKSRGCSCPPYAIPKNEENKTNCCPEPKGNEKNGGECESEQRMVNHCDKRTQIKGGDKFEKQKRDDRCHSHSKKKHLSSPGRCNNQKRTHSCVTKSSQENKDLPYRCDTPKKDDVCDKGISRKNKDSSVYCETQKINDLCDAQFSRKSSSQGRCEEPKISDSCIQHKSSNRNKGSSCRCETWKIDHASINEFSRKKQSHSDFYRTKNNSDSCETSHSLRNYSEKEQCECKSRVSCEDPCKVKMFTFKADCNRETEGKDQYKIIKKEEQYTDTCEEKTDCPQKRTELEIKDACKTTNEQTNDFSKVKKDVGCQEEKQSDYSINLCKEIKIPELAPCCKVDAAKECLSRLKELQRQWEEVIAAQESGRKNDCSQESRSIPAKKIHRRSNMIYVVLSAILGAVFYYIYNGDFEPDQLFLEEKQENKDSTDDED